MGRFTVVRASVLALMSAAALHLGCGVGADETPEELEQIGVEEEALDGAGDKGKGRDKVLLCHVPPGNPGNAHVIRVGEPAKKAHLKHHDDYVIKCDPKKYDCPKPGDKCKPKKDDKDKRGDKGKGRDKVLLCHVPPGNPGNAHVIRVAKPGAKAHLKHHEGDHILTCDPKKYDCPKPGDKCKPKYKNDPYPKDPPKDDPYPNDPHEDDPPEEDPYEDPVLG